jgi:hypothetical protein
VGPRLIQLVSLKEKQHLLCVHREKAMGRHSKKATISGEAKPADTLVLYFQPPV